jgi:hypothetical protein
MPFTINPAECRKALVALASFASAALADGLLTGQVAHFVSLGLGLLGAAGVFVVPNAPNAAGVAEAAVLEAYPLATGDEVGVIVPVDPALAVAPTPPNVIA